MMSSHFKNNWVAQKNNFYHFEEFGLKNLIQQKLYFKVPDHIEEQPGVNVEAAQPAGRGRGQIRGRDNEPIIQPVTVSEITT